LKKRFKIKGFQKRFPVDSLKCWESQFNVKEYLCRSVFNFTDKPYCLCTYCALAKPDIWGDNAKKAAHSYG